MRNGLIGLMSFGLSILPSSVLANNPSIPYRLIPKVDEQDYVGKSEDLEFCAEFYKQGLKKDGREIGFFYSKVGSKCNEKPVSVWIDSNDDGDINRGEIFRIEYFSSDKNLI